MSCNFCFVPIYLPFLLDDQGDFDSYNIKIYVWNKQQEASMSPSPFSYYFMSPQPAYKSWFLFFVRKNIAKRAKSSFFCGTISAKPLFVLYLAAVMKSEKTSITVWKFQDFSVIQILREINFGHSRSCETAILAIFGALNFANLVNFRLQKVLKFIKIKIQNL